jgi:hypothetical protein
MYGLHPPTVTAAAERASGAATSPRAQSTGIRALEARVGAVEMQTFGSVQAAPLFSRIAALDGGSAPTSLPVAWDRLAALE